MCFILQKVKSPSHFLKGLFMVLLFFLHGPLSAEHIMGGNVDFRYVGEDSYRLGLRVIIDCERSNQVAWFENDGINIGMYSKSSNELVDYFLVQLQEGKNEEVKPTRDECNLEIPFCMMVLSYYDTFYFDPEVYDDPNGYYFSWERCCRNQQVTNLSLPAETGMTFYAEVPPFSIKNSLPRVKKVPLTLLCVNALFNYDFNIRDTDGDEIKVSLTEPLRGGTTSNQPNDWNKGKDPRLEPGPYAPVTWSGNFGVNNIMNGNPDILIDEQTGRLTVRPRAQGTFVFAIKVEEFRDGVKLGQMNMEMQYVVKPCSSNPPPTFTTDLTDSVFEIYPNQNFELVTELTDEEDSVFITLESEIFQLSTEPVASYTKRSRAGFARAVISWKPSCEQVREEPYRLVINAADNGCPLPSYAKVEVFIKVLEPPILEPPGVFCIERLNDEDLQINWDHRFGFAYGGVVIEEDKGAGWELVDTVRDKGLRSIVYNAPGNQDENFCYRIRTINQCNVVSDEAKEFCSIDDIGVIPETVVLTNVTVNENEHIELVWEPNTNKDFNKYLIYRSRNDEGYQLLKTLGQQERALCVDSNLNTDSNFYRYYLVATNGCGLVSENSAVASSILLKYESARYRDSLYWTPFDLWTPNGFEVLGSSLPSNKLLQEPVNGLEYIHELEVRDDGVWAYRVKAVGSDGLESFSNQVEVIQKPVVWIPSAFSPNGDERNPFWKIHADFVTEYHLRVFNRWGQQVFESTDPLVFWEGKGAAESNYIYLLYARGLDGEIIYETGPVLLLR